MARRIQIAATSNRRRGAAAAAAAFTPGDISSCVLWLESKEGITDVSTKVSVWDDTISGTTNEFTQTTDANRPTLTADIFGTGVSSVKPDGSNDVMVRGDTSALDALSTSEWTWIFRLKTPSSIATGTKTYISKWNNTPPKVGYYHGEWNNSGSQRFRMQMAGGGNYTMAYGNTQLAINTKYTVEMHNTEGNPDGTGWEIYVGVDDATPAAQTMTTMGDPMTGGGDNDEDVTIFSRGVGTTGYRPDHDFACIGFFNVNMLDNLSDLNNVRTYISDNYP